MLERLHTSSIPHGADELETEADHTHAFNSSLGRTVAEIIRRGLICASAKQKFPRRYEQWIKDALNCSRGYAFKCKAVAENRFLLDASNWKHFPPSTAALYYLSGISPERLLVLVEGGELHAKLTIPEAVQLAEAEQGDDDYRPRRATAPARRRETPANAEGIDTDVTESPDAPEAANDANGDDDIDRHRLLVDAEDVVEDLKQTFSLCRRRIDAIETHASRNAKALFANELRDIAQSLNYRADALDPPTTGGPEVTRVRRGRQ